MNRPYTADTVVRALATMADKSFENIISKNNYSNSNNDNNNNNKCAESVRVLTKKKSTTKNNNRDVEKDPNGSAEKGPEVIAQTQRAVVKAAVPLLYTVLS